MSVSAHAGGTAPFDRSKLTKELADAPGVILEDTQEWTVDSSKIVQRVHRRVLLLTRESFIHADQGIAYEAKSSEVKNFKARTIRENGSTYEVTEGLMHDTVVYQDERREWRTLQFTFPGVETGAVVEWEYELSTTDTYPVRWWEVQADLPVMKSRFLVRSKTGSPSGPLSVQAFARREYAPWCGFESPRLENGYDIVTLTCWSVPRFRKEDLAPPDSDARVRILMVWSQGRGSLRDTIWNYSRLHYKELIEKCSKERKAARALAHEVAPERLTAAEKIDKISGWVKKKIVPRANQLSMGLTGLYGDCRSPDATLAAGGGGPEEVALLTMALLEEAGVKVHPVLVGDRTRARFDVDIPDSQEADHLILQVITESGAGYLDPGCKYCQAGIPDWKRCGGRGSGIRISSVPGSDPVEVPLVKAEFNSQRWSDKVVIATDGSARVEGAVTYQAQQDVALRDQWEDLTAEGRREDFLRRIPGDLEDTEVVLSDPEVQSENMKVSYRYKRLDMALPSGDRLLLPAPGIFNRILSMPMEEDRTLPVWWPCARSALVETTYVAPEGFHAASIPAPIAIEGPGLRFDGAWARGERESEIAFKGLLLVKRASIGLSDYPAAREFAFNLQQALRGGVMLVPGGTLSQEPK